MATPVHRHSREDEAFYVLDGEVSVYVGDDVVRAGVGDFLWAPRDVPHAFCVESPRARLLVVSTPGGFDRFFLDTGEPAAALTVPPPGAVAPPDPDALVAALAAYGVDVVAPPPAPTPPR
jgi:uncharacterized RmlC-like cupin family protein